ncbi:MAG: hypothetical protein AAGD43_02575 [Pseudomonadota bacterium]
MIDPHGTDKPRRAHSLVGVFCGDTADDLASCLERFADDIRRADVTVGISGSPSDGAIYSYRVTPEQTHDAYFAQINEWLSDKKAERNAKEES